MEEQFEETETLEKQDIESQKRERRAKRVTSTRNIVYSALFTALIVAGSYITIDIQPVPFTMQLPYVLLTSLLLGPIWGTVSVFVYIALGLMGVPVFSSKGSAGIAYVLKPSFGYIIGFLVASVVVGMLAKSKENDKLKPYQRMMIANTIGVLIIYAIGMLYMFLILKLYLAAEVTVKTIFLSGFLIFLPKEMVFIVLTALLASKLKPYVNTEIKQRKRIT